MDKENEKEYHKLLAKVNLNLYMGCIKYKYNYKIQEINLSKINCINYYYNFMFYMLKYYKKE